MAAGGSSLRTQGPIRRVASYQSQDVAACTSIAVLRVWIPAFARKCALAGTTS